ncbi:MAG TPA: hypothetical protein VGH81_14750 [Rudaea sp.]
MENRNRNRLVLIAIALVFAAPIVTALLLNASGWRPVHTRNSGTLVQPPLDVGNAPVTLADGSKLVWRDPQWHWTLLALANGDCAQACQTRLAELVRMRITLNRNAERLRIVYLGASLPAPAADAAVTLLTGNDDASALTAYRPAAPGELALALVDPNGLLMMRYAAGYDAALLRGDIVKVVH